MKEVKLLINEYKNEEVELISKKFNLTHISSRVILNRDLETFDEIDAFLKPDFKYFEDATTYKDLQKGCEKIIEALKLNQKILVYGDYDVDGITSISQFMMFLTKAGADINYYVPEREREGYGISKEFIQSIRDGNIKVDLLITVDCGIAEIEVVNIINSFGIDVIILDHHQCTDKVPKAYAVINPKQADCNSINKQLCAAGLSFKFLKHLNTYLKVEDIEEKLLELACLGTIADIVDLIKDNRIITYHGLKYINKTQIIGLRKLIEKAQIADKMIEAFHIGYILAPRINAAGRMDTAHKAIKLMLTNDERESEELAEELENFNILRKQTEQQIFDEAVNKIENDRLHKKHVIIVSGDCWHEGVLGIVASKITEKYEKPSIIISVKDEIGKGSARSLSYLDIYETLKYNDRFLLKYGGHKMAAGLTINQSDINEFSSEINKYVADTVSYEALIKEIEIDSYIENRDMTDNFYKEISKFEPFGHGNRKPVFALKNVSVKDLKKVGKNGNHLSFAAVSSDKTIGVIGFNKIHLLESLLTKPESLIVNISGNEFRGNRYLQYVLINIEKSDKPQYYIDEYKVKIINSLINKSKSKIIKTDIFKLVDKINDLYNTKTTAEEILSILKNDSTIEYAIKGDILYIKR